MEPLVSIIVPVYNTEAYLQRCVESITTQTYTNTEIILVNDGSTDNSLALCRSLAEKDQRIKVLSQENRGVAAARNTGIEYSTGDYFILVDSDDALTENAVELLVCDAQTFGGDIIAGARIRLKEGQEDRSIIDTETGELTVLQGTEALEKSLNYERFTASACAKLYRKAFVGDIRFEEGRKVNEDGYFIFECCLKKPVFLRRDTFVYKYYLRENSASRSAFSEKYLDMLYFSEKKASMVREKFPELTDLATNMEVSTHLFFLAVLCRTNDPKYRVYEKQSIRFVKEHHRNFRTAHRFEQRMVKIVSYGLFPIYKWVLRRLKKM